MELTGTLDRFPLRELLEMMQYSSMCGVLEIEAREGMGAIYAKDGQVYHAAYDGATGNLALWLLFEELGARFHVRNGLESEGRTLSSDLAYLMTEGEQRAARWQAIRPRIPNLRMVPAFTQSNQAGVRIDEADWPIMAAIDGQRSINDIASHAFIDTLDTCRILLRMLDAGLVRLLPAGSAASDQSWTPPSDSGPRQADSQRRPQTTPSPPARSGLFKRPLGTAQTGGDDASEPTPPKSLLGRLRESLPSAGVAKSADDEAILRALGRA